MARTGFFGRFEADERKSSRPISLSEGDWKILEAYRMFGCSKAGIDISLQKIVGEILKVHVTKDKSFIAEKDHWLSQLKDNQAEEDAKS